MEAAQDVVGWGQRGAAWARPEASTVSRAIAMALYEAGIRESFGVLGGGITPFAAGLAATPIRFFHFRHEAGAGFAALESSLETGRPGVVVVTTGPGLFNVLNAAMAARVEDAKYLVISGFTSRPQVGRGAVQETSLATMPADLLRPGSVFHDVALPESVDELAGVLARFSRGFKRPGGFVAHLGLPLALQTQLMEQPLPNGAAWDLPTSVPETATLDRCLESLAHPSSVLWLGHGAMQAHATLRQIAERAHLPVICSPRAKGVFPESHPLFVGVSGAGGSSDVQRFFASHHPRHALVVGTRLGEVTSFLSPNLCPTEGWIHVDLDASAFGAAFPFVPGLGIVADAKVFAEALHQRAEETGWYNRRQPVLLVPRAEEEPLVARAEPTVRPPFLIQSIQEQFVERGDALIMSEAGTSFTWCNTHLRFDAPGRYRISAAWGSMGHFTTGCVGTALVGNRRVVAVAGDCAMLMNNEINTAVQYNARVIWIVLNDAQFGLNHHGMSALGMKPVETQIPRTDFVAFARSQGADGVAVRSEMELEAALLQAEAASGPFVIDVEIDRSIASPVVAERARSLQRQAEAS